MKRVLLHLAALAALAIAGAALGQAPDPLAEIRYCGVPARDATTGVIKRRKDVLAAFRRAHPCPITGAIAGACPGWQINHVIPLAVGGCDAVWNLDWMPVQIKTCGADYCRDRFERKIYAVPMQPVAPIRP